jgi:hypothetical protein
MNKMNNIFTVYKGPKKWRDVLIITASKKWRNLQDLKEVLTEPKVK